MKSPNATSELGLWINSVMSNFKYQDSDRAGILINRKPEMDDLYIQRLKNVWVIVNDHDEVIKRPKKEELYKYKASYRKKTEALSLLNKRGGKSFNLAGVPNDSLNTTPSMGTQSSDSSGSGTQKSNQSDKNQKTQNSNSKEKPLSPPAGFVIGIQEPRVYEGRITGLRGHRLLYDTSCKTPRAALFHSRNLNIWPVGEYTDGDMCTGVYIEAEFKPKIYITSVYCPSDAPMDEVISKKLFDLVKKVKNEKSQLIIMADRLCTSFVPMQTLHVNLLVYMKTSKNNC